MSVLLPSASTTVKVAWTLASLSPLSAVAASEVTSLETASEETASEEAALEAEAPQPASSMAAIAALTATDRILFNIFIVRKLLYKQFAPLDVRG